MNTVNKWAEIEKSASPDVLAALKRLYDFYDGHGIVRWAAGLYDPEIGGFYYSNSARDTEGYLPDLESTWQLLGVVGGVGAWGTGNGRNSVLPEQIKRKICDFVRSTQCERDGYFYHPQWPQGRENLQTDRYGRDMGWATGMLSSLTVDGEKQYPKYCTPNGVKCKAHAGTDERCSFPDAAARVVANSKTNPSVASHPDYSSREAFSAWLETYNADIKKASGRAHNLAALKEEIVQHGYADVVLDHLDRVQAELFEEQSAAGIEPTGLWQTNINYQLVWGLLKYITYYNHSTCGRAIDMKYVPYIVKSCIKVTALAPDGAYRMNDLFNQWNSINWLIQNVRKYHGDEATSVIYDIVRENAASLIDNSLKKITPFKMDDGSFAYQSNGLSMRTIYGVPIAEGVREGDVNAVACCHAMYQAVFRCLGYDPMPLCDERDGELFVKMIMNAEPPKKKSAQ